MILRLNLFIICALLFVGNSQANNNAGFDDEMTAVLEAVGDWMNATSEAYEDPNYPQFSDEHYKQSFLALSGAIDYKLTSKIKEQILRRVNKHRSSTERTLGLTEMYFPVFEEYLAKKGMPRHLKYLPIIESNLNPVARSHAAAVGLWQFIPSTGKMYGLRINSSIDERSDTYKATDAATSLLANLYKRYGDWCLALAAYNCGSVRVDRLVKSKGYNYWNIRSSLPKETQMYVPYFMAAVYTYEYHSLHGLQARSLPSDLVLTDTVHLGTKYQSFRTLIGRYNVSKEILQQLNPVYFKNYVPSNSKNNILVLPARVVAQARGLESKYNRIVNIATKNPIKCIRRVNSEEELKILMSAHLCNRADVLYWNRLPKNYTVQEGDIIAFRKNYSPKYTQYQPLVTRKMIESIKIHSLKVVGLDDNQDKALTAPVYTSIKINKKTTSNLLLKMPTATNKNQLQTKAITAAKTASAVPSARINTKEQILKRVSVDRSRGRRLRTKVASSKTITTKENSTILATKSKLNKSNNQRVVNEEKYLKIVTDIGLYLQNKEVEVLESTVPSSTANTLKIIEQQTNQMRLERVTKEDVQLPTRTRGRMLRN